MKRDVIITLVCFVLSALCFFKLCSNAEKNDFPKIYYYMGEEKVYYILNKDGTAKIKTSMGGTDFVYDTSWNTNGGRIWIKTQMGYSNIIWEGYVYKDIDDANAKRNGIKLTLQE